MGGRQGVLTPLFPHRRAFPTTGRTIARHVSIPLLSLGRERPERVSTLLRSHQWYQQYRTRLSRCRVGILFPRIVCICALIVVQPHSPLQDRRKRWAVKLDPASKIYSLEIINRFVVFSLTSNVLLL